MRPARTLSTLVLTASILSTSVWLASAEAPSRPSIGRLVAVGDGFLAGFHAGGFAVRSGPGSVGGVAAVVARQAGARGDAHSLAVPGEDTASIFDAVTDEALARALEAGVRPRTRDLLKPFILGVVGEDEQASQLSRARGLDPDLVLVWLGTTDALRLIAPETARVDPVPAEDLGARFRRMLDLLAESGADLAVANVPDPSRFPALQRAADALTDEDTARLRATIDAYNVAIAEAIADVERRHDIRIVPVDMFRLFEQLAQHGVDLDEDGAPDLTTRHRGGLFAVDGLHPTRAGSAVVANAFIDAINLRSGTTIPRRDVARGAAHDRRRTRRPRAEREPSLGADLTPALPKRTVARLSRRLAAAARTQDEPFTTSVAGVPGSYLMLSGLETGERSEFDTTRNCPIVAAPVCTGRRACQKGTTDQPSSLWSRPLEVPEAYVRAYHHVTVTATPSPTEACAPIIGFDRNQIIATCSADACVQPDGRVRYRLRDRVNGVSVGSPTEILPASTWRRIEVRAFLRPGINDDECELRVDGTTVAASTTLDLGTSVLNVGFVTNRQGAYQQPATPGFWLATFDDVAITVGQWPGPGRVIARQGRPGIPTYDQFLPFGEFPNLNPPVETGWSDTPANDQTRAESPSTGDPVAQTMLVAPFNTSQHAVTAPSQISACQTWIHANTPTAPNRTYGIRRRVAGANTDTVIPGMETLGFTFSDALLGGFWSASVANLNAAEIGAVKAGGAGGTPMRVNDAWLVCEYEPPAGEAACGATELCVPAWGTAANGALPGFANVADGVSCTTGGSPAGYTVQSCSIELGAAPAGNVRCAVYDGTPDPNRRALCSSAVTPAAANGVNTLPVSGCPALSPNAAYWIVWNNDNSGIEYRLSSPNCAGPSGSSRVVSAPFPSGGWAPDPWGATSPDTCRPITYLNLVPLTGAPPTTSTSTSTSTTSTFGTSTTSTTILGLVAAYGFGEGAGTIVADASGNGNGGTVAGATWTAAGRFGSALLFDGIDDWVTVPDAPSLDLTTAMTLEAWVFPTATPVSWRAVVTKERPQDLAYFLHANGGGSAPATGGTIGGVERALAGASPLPVNAWTHLAATYDGATIRLYVNGAQATSQSVAGAVATSANPLRIGGHAVFGEFFQGRIDDVRVYARALTAGEILADMNLGVGP